MISIGLDLSLAKTGIVILEDGESVYQGLVKSKPSGPSPRKEALRLIDLCRDIELTIEDQIAKYSDTPDIVVIEGLAFMARNTTALVQLSGLNYLVRSMLIMRDWPFVIVPPTSLKKFVTGKGNAQKDLVLLNVYKNWGGEITDDNIADAFGLAKIGEGLLSGGLDDKLTKPQKEVINAVTGSNEYGQ